MIRKFTETQDEISRALLLANGDVSFAIKTETAAERSFSRNRMPFFYSGDPVSTHTNNGTVIYSSIGTSANVSVVYPFNDMPAVSNDSRFLVRNINVPVNFSMSSSGNFSDDVRLNSASDQIPAVLQSSANTVMNIVPLPLKIFSGIGKGGPAVSMHEDGNGSADHAENDSMQSPKRNLVLSASEKENIKTYQLGGETVLEAGVGNCIVSESCVYSSSMAVIDCCRPAVVDYDFPCVIGGDLFIGEDECGEECFCWIGIHPVVPWYGWIEPWRPAIIDMPIWSGEFEIVENFGIELTEDWVDFEESDISMIELEYSAKLSFIVRAADEASFTVCKSSPAEDGSCELTAIQTSSLVLNSETGYYEVTTKELLLDSGEYYIAIESSGKPEGGSSYIVSVNDEVTEYFTDGDNSDDWTDMQTAGANGEVLDIGTMEDYSFFVLNDWVGYGDSVDYAGFTLDSAAKLSFSIDATDAAKFTIYQLVENKNGSYSLKVLQTTTLSYDRDFEDYEAVTKGLLLSAGTYYISVQSTNAAQGGSAYYNVYINDEDTVFFTDGDNSDDWTDMKTAGADGEVFDLGTLDEYSFYGLNDWVGYGDSIDYAGFTLESVAKLSFSIDATDAAKFTIYQLVENKTGSYSLKVLQTTTLSYDHDFEDYEAVTKGLLLSAGTYYISVQSTNAAQGGSAYYNVYINDEDTEFFSYGDNSDDWTDMKTAGADGEVFDIGTLDEYSYSVLNDWVGCGDSIDYAGFTLESDANLSFSIDATDAAKFTIYQLVENKDNSYSLKVLQTTTLSYDHDFEDYEAVTKGLQLSAGTYYISLQSTNAAQGGSAYYNITVDIVSTASAPLMAPENDTDLFEFCEICAGSCGLSMPETDRFDMPEALNLTDVLKPCRYDDPIFFSASASSIAELDGSNVRWLNFAALA